jgi:hypothetical protein
VVRCAPHRISRRFLLLCCYSIYQIHRGLPLRQGLKSYSGETKKTLGKRPVRNATPPAIRIFSSTRTSTVFWPRYFFELSGKRASLRSQIMYGVAAYTAQKLFVIRWGAAITTAVTTFAYLCSVRCCTALSAIQLIC